MNKTMKILLGLIALLVMVALVSLFFVLKFQKEEKIENGKEIILPPPRKSSQVSIEEAILKRRSIREYKREPLSLKEISQLLWAAQGITDSSGKRSAPSAGALYPLKVYVIGEIENLSPAIYQYHPFHHSLIKILDKDLRKEITEAAYGQEWVEKAPVLFLFTGNYEIVAQKYGREKASRFTHMEVGHAAQNLYLQTVSLNLGTVAVGGFDVEKIKKILALPQEEEPLYIMPVGKIKFGF